MPTQVRIISKKISAEWDHLVETLLSHGYGVEHVYYGCSSQERADEVRRHVRTAARKKQVACRAYWAPCPTPGQCAQGGPECTHHTMVTFFDLEVGRAYKARQAQQNAR